MRGNPDVIWIMEKMLASSSTVLPAPSPYRMEYGYGEMFSAKFQMPFECRY